MLDTFIWDIDAYFRIAGILFDLWFMESSDLLNSNTRLMLGWMESVQIQVNKVCLTPMRIFFINACLVMF